MKNTIKTDTAKRTVTVLSDSEDILNDGPAMHDVKSVVRCVFGEQAACLGRGYSYFAGGVEAGWTWDVQ